MTVKQIIKVRKLVREIVSIMTLIGLLGICTVPIGLFYAFRYQDHKSLISIVIIASISTYLVKGGVYFLKKQKIYSKFRLINRRKGEIR